MGSSATVTPSSLPPLPPGAQMNSAPTAGSGLPPLPPGAQLTSGTPTPPQPAQDALSDALTTSAKPEVTYQMKNPQGQTVGIPYSNVHRALDQGHLFADKGTLQQYARDLDADPLNEDRVDQWISKHPYLAPLLGSDVLQTLEGVGTGALKTWTGADRTPTSRLETDLQLAAAKPTHGVAQGAGEAGENLGEFFSGEELMNLLGKTGAAMSLGEKLKSATGLASMIEKYPMIGKLLKIGATAAKQGTIGGAQTYAKTGDPGAGLAAGGETALLSGGLNLAGAGGAAAKAWRAGVPPAVAPEVERTIAGVKIPVPEEAANATANPTAQASTRAYSALSRDAIKPHLEALSVAPQIVEDTLATTHDLTGAADRMREKVLNPLYENLNQVTGGKFRTLNSEVQQAQKLARSGLPENVAAYKNKLAEMENLFDTETGGAVPKQYLSRLKAAWTQNYMLDDLGDMWDRNMNGAPGASQVSQSQRGLNGNGLMRDIQRAVKVYGRDRIETALGPGRLENFEDIARWNQTNANRKAFNIGLREVAAQLPKDEAVPPWGKRAMAMTVGGGVAHLAGQSPYYGMVAGEATYETTRAVLNAIRTNPAIGKNFMFALESGATPAKYGPFIATMIQKANTEASRERQANESHGAGGEW